MISRWADSVEKNVSYVNNRQQNQTHRNYSSEYENKIMLLTDASQSSNCCFPSPKLPVDLAPPNTEKVAAGISNSCILTV